MKHRGKSPEFQKLAFVGTSCTGKTTLLEHYKQRHAKDKSVGFVPEAARLFFMHNSVADRFSEESQTSVQDLALRLEQKAPNLRRLYCDRSVLDAPAYLLGQRNYEGAHRLLNAVSFWIPSYHAILQT
jgi:predicted ATPase